MDKIFFHRLPTSKGQRFRLGKGVKQGDPLSPNLFNSVLEMVFRNLDWERRGIKIDGTWLNYLCFAGDIAVISGNIQKLRLMAEELC